MKKIIYLFLFVISLSLVSAAAPNVSLGPCYSFSTVASDDGAVTDLVIEESCSNAGEVDWTGSTLNLTVLGSINTGVSIGNGTITVNSLLRPDLDQNAHLTFNNLNFVVEPNILRDGVVCPSNVCENSTFDLSENSYEVDVTGFSTYTLTARTDMTVYTDSEAYLKPEIYQTIDFGPTNITYKCVVMIFDRDNKNLLQSNPRRQKREADVLSISTDLNLEDNSPEYLGYFKSESGLVNSWYQKDLLIGYDTFIYVAKCHGSDGSEKVYEELIIPHYWEPFKSAPARWVWWTESASVSTWMIFFIAISALIIYLAVKKNW